MNRCTLCMLIETKVMTTCLHNAHHVSKQWSQPKWCNILASTTSLSSAKIRSNAKAQMSMFQLTSSLIHRDPTRVMIGPRHLTLKPLGRLKRFRHSRALERWWTAFQPRLRNWRQLWLTITKASLNCQPWTMCCPYQSTAYQWLTYTHRQVTSKWWPIIFAAISAATSSKGSSCATLTVLSDMSAMTGN